LLGVVAVAAVAVAAAAAADAADAAAAAFGQAYLCPHSVCQKSTNTRRTDSREISCVCVCVCVCVCMGNRASWRATEVPDYARQ
jgi:hypothetical protein